MIPSEGDALALHKKYGSSDRIITHCQTVAKVAVILTEELEWRGVGVDAKAVVAAALLHDIGRSRVQTVMHGAEGSEIIEREGVDRRVVEIVRKHVGAGISPDEADKLGMPKLDYVPGTLEERLVCFADKMVDSDSVRPFDGEVRRFVTKKHDVARLLALERGMREELGTDPSQFVLDKIKESR
ncbi:MAG: HDIG domain-containing protein [Nitrososphaerota archaeon]|nr:HDIG domain-containing protein [Nitrososphaerota archaeon]